ncbi:glycosyl transferase [Pilimelia terevasa]|uniref:Glycosyl transferase n=1 Tax=Pilimelia terevasa TaxID=53372 RepID=A0A8J3BCG4_9ACTN|nr:glycosyltransferase [Pilimelia terevasa]GGK11402.1 glycosyl transferase [Pilimelia terevasa]
MNTISVITACHGPSVPYLAAAYDSLRRQVLPAGWGWEWCVQEDGQTGSVAEVLPQDERIKPGQGRPGGAGITRNMALARSAGQLVKVLDADDLLTDGALARDIAVLSADGSIGWVVSSVLDLLPDGQTVSWERADPAGGPLRGSEVIDYFVKNGYRLPIHPATMCIRRSLALALGGWMALPGGEDTGLLLAACALTDGYFNAEPGLLYRKHPDQITQHAGFTEPEEWVTRMSLIEARAAALSDGAIGRR